MSGDKKTTPPALGSGGTPAICTTAGCPLPILEIVDRKTGAVVSGTTQTVIVGQKMELLVRTKPAESMSNIQWTVPGQRVKDYTQSTTTGAKTDLAAGDLQGVNLDFYWIEGGSQAIQAAADVRGSRLTASVTHKILAPTAVTMTSVTGTVAISNPGFPGSGLELHFGTLATPGISFTFKATAPAGGDGQIAGFQLVETVRSMTPNGAAVRTLTSGGAFVLDTNAPYAAAVAVAAGAAATWSSSDTPGNGLENSIERMAISDHFHIYLMYQPTGTDSRWVTIARLDWNWGGTTTRQTPAGTGNVWNAPTGVANATNPSGAASIELPPWTANVTSLSFPP